VLRRVLYDVSYCMRRDTTNVYSISSLQLLFFFFFIIFSKFDVTIGYCYTIVDGIKKL
jgi:hypothetical protein